MVFDHHPVFKEMVNGINKFNDDGKNLYFEKVSFRKYRMLYNS